MTVILEDVLQTDEQQEKKAAQNQSATQAEPVWRLIVALGAQVSAEEWANVPTDGSIELKRYLYQQPKRP